ncbi:MAG: hypothetical protein ACI9SE_002622 [Neolewinella sp.]|jgi:hypothetical protein
MPRVTGNGLVNASSSSELERYLPVAQRLLHPHSPSGEAGDTTREILCFD